MPNFTVSTDIHSLLQAADKNAARKTIGQVAPDFQAIYPNQTRKYSRYSPNASTIDDSGDTLDFTQLPLEIIVTIDSFVDNSVTKSVQQIIGGQYLSGLEDFGTEVAFSMNSQESGHQMSASGINQFFTDLPSTTKTATLDFQYNPGSLTCDASIATAKGYTVITN